MAVKHPFLINKHNSKFRAIIMPIFLYAFVYNLPRFFHWEVGERKCKKYEYDYDPTSNTNATCAFTDITKFGHDRIYKLVTINTSTMDLIPYFLRSYSFCGHYSFLNLEILRSKYIRPKVTVHKRTSKIG